MAKLIVDMRQGLVEVDGDEDFVERVYGDIRELLVNQLSGATFAADPAVEEAGSDESKTKQPRKVTKRSGPSCASRIDALKAEKFFDTLRTGKEIGDKLREKGTAYEGKHIAAALLNMTSAGKLRRVKEDGGWKYQNP